MGSSNDELDALFAADGPLASASGSYNRRPEQVRLAREVALALGNRDVLLADAPTGTGKSLAYAAAAVLSGQKIVVSTATIALQHQLLTSDLPLLKKAVADLKGMPQDEAFTFAIMKGRRNFLCDRRADETIREPGFVEADADLLSEVDLWRQNSETGDREDLDFRVPAGLWMEVAADGEDCAPRACPHRDSCFYFAHRDSASEADALIVNHSLLLSNVAAFGNIFDTSGRHLIIDEAHSLEEIMSEAFGARVSYPRVRYVTRQALKKSEAAAVHEPRAMNAADLFFDDLRSNQGLGDENAAPRGYRALTSSLSAMRSALANDPKEEANALQGMVGRLNRDLKSFYAETAETHARAVMAGRSNSRDPNRRPYPELRSWLIETSDAFRDEVLWHFDEGGVVLTSATLAPAGNNAVPSGGGTDPVPGKAAGSRSFEYPRRRLGLGEDDLGRTDTGREVRELAVPEIFDYENRCLIYTEPSAEDGSANDTTRDRERDSERDIRRAEELVEASGGRALILLSTSRAVSAFRESFRTRYPLRFQGDDTPSKLVKWLKETDAAILVGTRTFWQGVDIAGDALSLCVIDRIPFPPPDDSVIEALCRKAGKAWFREVSLPRAQVAMRQGAGRLLRTPKDRGVVALLDSRLHTKNWGKAILRALPESPRTHRISDVREFFGATADEAGTTEVDNSGGGDAP